ncbi:hypothetical protein SLE2022_047370 [Rubroshorea leprosula]
MRKTRKRKQDAVGEDSSKPKRDHLGEFDTENFRSEEARSEFQEVKGKGKKMAFKDREVLPGRTIDINFLETIGFPFLEDFKKWNWIQFLTMERNYYTSLVKVFYFNMDLNGSREDGSRHIVNHTGGNKFNSFVLGKEFEINDRIVKKAIGVRVANGCKYDASFNDVEACKVVFEDNTLTRACFDINKLSMHRRLLHLIISYIINPRAGKHSGMTREDLWLMFKIITKDPPDLAHWILKCIKEIRNKHAAKLAFGKVISKILDNTFGKHIHEEFTAHSSETPIGKNSLSLMGYEEKDGQWVPKENRGKKKAASRQETERREEAESSQGISLLLNKIWEKLQELENSMKQMEKRQEALERHLGINPSASQP